jgi:metallo-beta-lactamase class B
MTTPNSRARRALVQAIAVALLAPVVLAPVERPLHAELSAEEQRWNEPVEPFRIAGNLYYVGARDVTSYLVTTPAGHVVIDSGFAETVPQVLANVRTLGFEPKDVKWLLISHPHYDHVGGIADLRDATGAKIAVSAADAGQAARGGVGDFAFGDRFRYRPFTADRLLHDGDTVAVGGATLTANVTPGHTRGCTSWSMDVVEAGKPLHVVFVCSVTAPGYQLARNEAYPRIVEDYRETFRRLATMPVDVFLAAHGSFFGLVEKRAALSRNPEQNPFVDPDGYHAHLARLRADLERKVAEQSQPRP